MGPDRFSTGISNRELHIHDISSHVGALPAGIIWPVSTEEVSGILAWTYRQEILVTPWGAGTSTEGNPVHTRGGLVMDFTRMNKILAIRPEDLQADVQPGVLRKELNRQTGQYGLFFPVDPGADASIGGMIANNASGVQTIKYGATKDAVMKLTVVLPAGEVIHTGCLVGKSSSGYDLTRLFVGSEGTLGAVTEATLKLTGAPSHHLTTVITFDDLESAAKAVSLMIGAGLEPAALELLPSALIRLMNGAKGLKLRETPSLFCGFHGVSKPALLETATLAEELAEGCGSSSFVFGVEEKERDNLWRARHEAWETIHQTHKGKESIVLDAAVPISRYPEMISFAQRLVNECNAVGYVFGHAGDGNLHVVLMGNPQDVREWSLLEGINDKIVGRAVELGGTCTGEHGVGIGKRKFMELEHGGSYQLMKKIKALIDPKGLMNPDKIFF
ncbi:MAG: FAD-binding oxidoreductase [Syntrophales bacterium]|nr:FAD-binding oxidoreductase [Syntrophales bacterium]